MPDEHAKTVTDSFERTVQSYEESLRAEFSKFPLDTMPVTLEMLAHYRNEYIHALRDLIRHTDTLRRLLMASDEAFDAWVGLDKTHPPSHGRRNPGRSDPRQDGDRQG